MMRFPPPNGSTPKRMRRFFHPLGGLSACLCLLMLFSGCSGPLAPREAGAVERMVPAGGIMPDGEAASATDHPVPSTEAPSDPVSVPVSTESAATDPAAGEGEASEPVVVPCFLGKEQGESVQIDGELTEWDPVPAVISLLSVDAGLDEPVTINLDAKWKLNTFKLAWDGESLLFAYDVADHFVLWTGNKWWEGDGFELFLSGNADYRNDMGEMMHDETVSGQDTCLQFYMAGPDQWGLWPGRTAASAQSGGAQVQSVMRETATGYRGEGRIPLSAVPALGWLMSQGEEIAFSVRFRSVDTDGLPISVSNVPLPVEKNKVRPASMQRIRFAPVAGAAALYAQAAAGAGESGVPAPISNLRAIPWAHGVSLFWANLSPVGCETVVVRNAGRVPAAPEDGVPVYRGTGTSFLDEAPFERDETRRYAAFSVAPDGSVSPAVTASLREGDVCIADYADMQAIVGTNAFIDDPVEKIAVAGSVREYHPWVWDEGNMDVAYPGDQRKFSPSYAGNGWDFDAYYRQLKERGIFVSPVIQQTTPWLDRQYFSNNAAKPVPAGSDTEDPASYAAHAAHLYQFAARYGAVRVPDGNLRLAPDQPRLSGLGYLEAVENWNEPDADWAGAAAHFTPRELVAMCSADYDGHLGSLGKLAGVKNADPSFKLVMGGLFALRTSYVAEMMAWADEHRNGSFPADVLNFHYYATDGLMGLTPEEDGMLQRLQRMNAWREMHLPDKELWLTEFGYDTYPKSKYAAPTELAQAQWLVRSYLAVAASGFERGFQFMLRNVEDTSTTNYGTSGLTTSMADGWQRKPSWFFANTLRTHLGDMVFDTMVETGSDVLAYRFRSRTENRGAYVVWSPTRDNRVIPEVALTLVPGAARCRMVELADDRPEGLVSELAEGDGTVRLQVGETPVLILFDQPMDRQP